MSQNCSYALDFLQVKERSTKPRKKGLTVVRDYGIGMNQAMDMVEAVGQYVDYLKVRHFFVLAATKDPKDLVMRKIKLYTENQIEVFPGGIVFETAYLRGKVDETFSVLREMGFTAVEISDNIITMTPEEKVKYVKMAKKHDLKVLCELGKKYATTSFSVKETAEEIKALIEIGAEAAVLERNELDLVLGEKADGAESYKLKQLVDEVGLEWIIFEAETKAHQNWLFRTFGPDVSLGPNIAPDRVPFLEAVRRGLGRESGYTFLTEMLPK